LPWITQVDPFPIDDPRMHHDYDSWRARNRWNRSGKDKSKKHLSLLTFCLPVQAVAKRVKKPKPFQSIISAIAMPAQLC
jgi:hypothetical protein